MNKLGMQINDNKQILFFDEFFNVQFTLDTVEIFTEFRIVFVLVFTDFLK